MLYLWSVLECYQYSLWRYIKLVNLNLNLNLKVVLNEEIDGSECVVELPNGSYNKI